MITDTYTGKCDFISANLLDQVDYTTYNVDHRLFSHKGNIVGYKTVPDGVKYKFFLNYEDDPYDEEAIFNSSLR
jgi:hypothetical protein